MKFNFLTPPEGVNIREREITSSASSGYEGITVPGKHRRATEIIASIGLYEEKRQVGHIDFPLLPASLSTSVHEVRVKRQGVKLGNAAQRHSIGSNSASLSN